MLSWTLIDGPSATIVLGGTLLATLLRCGWRESAMMLQALRHIGQRSFEAERARAELAVQVQEIRQDGIMRAQRHHVGDSEFDEATDAMLSQRSIAALLAAHERHKALRLSESNIAVRVLAQAAELAPVFGMAGTLLALNRLSGDDLAAGNFTGAIGMAVLTTLYGLLAANLLFAPLSRLIERAALNEEAERQTLVDWLAAQIAEACPEAGGYDRRKAAA